MLFQSTLPCGSDKLVLSNSIAIGRKFQSTLPCGSDLRCGTCPKRAKISIHAPSRERRYSASSCCNTQLFQSTLPHGSDLYAVDGFLVLQISIHAPLRERLRLHYNEHSACNFNPRSLAGATYCTIWSSSFFSVFQSTLPHGSDRKAPKSAQRWFSISIHAPSQERR